MNNINESSNNTADLIKSINNAFKAKDTQKLGELLVSLSQIEPLRWMTLLYLNGIIPEPKSQDFYKKLATLFRALSVSVQEVDFDTEKFSDLLIPVLSIGKCFKSIREKLDAIEVWEKVGARVIYRTAAFLEDQYHIAMNQLETAADDRGYYDNRLLLNDNLPTRSGGANTNLIAAYEENCENLQLILSYTLQRYKSEFCGNVIDCKSPYNDKEFTGLISLASMWRTYESLWENIIYLGWYPQAFDTNNGIQLYGPRDSEEYFRFKIAGIREQEILSESAFNNKLGPNKQTINKIKHLANSIRIPNAGEVWDGNLDIEAFRDCISLAKNQSYADYEMYRHYYDELIDEVRIGEINAQVSWKKYHDILLALRQISEAFIDAINREITGLETSDQLRKVIIVTRSCLLEILISTLEYDVDSCKNVINVLIFNPERKHLEIWDTPLIEIGDEKILFIPALIQMGSSARAIENAVALWNPDLFQKRGKILENRLIDFLRSQQINAQGQLSFSTKDGNVIECDLVTYWDGYLLLIEAKCTKAIVNASDMFRAKRHIEKAVNQLEQRKEAVVNNWESFRLAVNHINLPTTPISQDKIRLIAVTNVLEFTGWKINQVVVTDEFCLQRFFGESDIEVISFSPDGVKVAGSLGRIRKSSLPSASEFLIYLEDPPQVKIVRECLSMQPIWLPTINKDDPKIGMLHAVYNPEKHPGQKIINKLFGAKKSKQRKRHRKT